MPPADSPPNDAFKNEKGTLTFDVPGALWVMFVLGYEPPVRRTLSLASFATNEDSKHASKPQLTTAVLADRTSQPEFRIPFPKDTL